MSFPIMKITSEDLNAVEKRGKFTVCIVGCGQVGLHQAVLFADAGFRVICYDSDQIVVNNIGKGRAPLIGKEVEAKLKDDVRSGQLTATNDLKTAISQSSIVVFMIPAHVDSKKKADYSQIESMCKKIGPNLQSGSLFILGRPVGTGITGGLVKEIIENSSGFKVGEQLGLAYSPIYTAITQGISSADAHRRIVAAADTNSLNVATAVLERIAIGELKKTDSFRVAEAAALIEIQRRDVRAALAIEMASLCERLGTDFFQVDELLEGRTSSSPLMSSGLVGEESYLLLADIENIGLKLRLPAIAREVNEQAVRHMVNLVKDALKACGKTFRRSRISLLGISQMPNMKASIKKSVRQTVQLLAARGAKISLYDPYLSESDVTDIQSLLKRNLNEVAEGADCIVILTGHDQFKRINFKRLKLIMKMPAAVVDLDGIIDPSKVEKEGFIYRGLGRGVWTK